MRKWCRLATAVLLCQGLIGYPALLDAAPGVQTAGGRDFVSPGGAFRIKATGTTLWPPDVARISGPPSSMLLDGAVVIRPLKAHKRVQISSGGHDGALKVNDVGAKDSANIAKVRFDVENQTIQNENGVLVLRDGDGRSLTLYPSP